MKQPVFITFTGIDDRCDPTRLAALADLYPVEFGILISDKNRDARFPCSQAIQEFQTSSFHTSGHFCGSAAKDMANNGTPPGYLPFGIEFFNRVQINGRFTPRHKGITRLKKEIEVILQHRDQDFPTNTPENVFHLFDRSGGKGWFPEKLPETVMDETVGYAGGINPENVLEFIRMIPGSHKFWIDMETGVRTNGWFDIEKAYQVCRQVYRT